MPLHQEEDPDCLVQQLLILQRQALLHLALLLQVEVAYLATSQVHQAQVEADLVAALASLPRLQLLLG